MSGSSTPFGLQPLKHISGLVRPEVLKLTKALAEALPTTFQNTPVQLDTSGRLALAANGSSYVGVFQGIEYTDLASGRPTIANQWQNGTTVKDFGNDSARVYFTVDPAIQYRVQANGSLAASSIGDQIDFTTISAGNTTTGLSSVQVDTATLKGAGVQGMARIVEIDWGVDNDWGDSFTVVVVQIARHQFVANIVAI